MELAKSSLENEINGRAKNRRFFSIIEMNSIIEKMAGCLCMCQQNEISHKDIKPANILMFEGDVYKLSDFGLSAFADRIDRT
jgi:serine/threonine protein kinase